MSYKIILTENAVEGILRLRKAGERQALKKIDRLLSELEEHPETGTGKPERLKGELSDALRSVIVSFMKYSTSM